jgi:hypothetical protein
MNTIKIINKKLHKINLIILMIIIPLFAWTTFVIIAWSVSPIVYLAVLFFIILWKIIRKRTIFTSFEPEYVSSNQVHETNMQIEQDHKTKIKKIEQKWDRKSDIPRKLRIVNIVFIIFTIYLIVWITFITVAWSMSPLIYLVIPIFIVLWKLVRKWATIPVPRPKMNYSEKKYSDKNDTNDEQHVKVNYDQQEEIQHPFDETIPSKISMESIADLSQFQSSLIQFGSDVGNQVILSSELMRMAEEGKVVVLKGDPFKLIVFWLNLFITLMAIISTWFTPIPSIVIMLLIYVSARRKMLILHPEGFLIRQKISQIYCQKWENITGPPQSKVVYNGQGGAWFVLNFESLWEVKIVKDGGSIAWGMKKKKKWGSGIDITSLKIDDINKIKMQKKLDFLREIATIYYNRANKS